MYKYGMRARPRGSGCQPYGYIEAIEKDKWIDGYWTELTYDRELTELEIYAYELIKL